MVGTLFVRVPVPGGGYFNLGDTLIVFAGLYAGSRVGALAGGVGSALADLMGFPLFAPITLVAKGVEGFLCGLGSLKNTKTDHQGSTADDEVDQPNKKRYILLSYLMPALGVLSMVALYFIGCAVFPTMGLAVAVADLPANLLQALVGYLGGRVIYLAYNKLLQSL